MSTVPDPIREGLARGWKVAGGAHRPRPGRVECDVAIIGSGAGGGVSAELLARAGLNVVIVEEGPLRSSRHFDQQEAIAYPTLYQESAGRKTADKAINILQGRCVGGSTTVNWTSSFRTPPDTLRYWRRHFGLEFDGAALTPYFEQAERRLNIAPWLVPPNENNDLLRRGAARLGIASALIPRNVKGCANLGSCGMGCPLNAKQSMLVTTIPAALDAGATLLVETRAERFEIANGRVQSLVCVPAAGNGGRADGPPAVVVARHFVLAGGGINSPVLLSRSQAPDPHDRLGRRTFLHPVVLSSAVMPARVAGWQGAPQSVYSDHFLGTQPIDGPIGFKIEAPPLHPVLFAASTPGIGREHADALRDFPHTHVLIALMRDGFHPDAPGGTVNLRGDGSAVLDYPLTPFVLDGARRALLAMAELQFAAGARQVMPGHEMARPFASWTEASAGIEALPMDPLLTKVVSAHVMGGCGAAARAVDGVVGPDGVHWQLANLSVHDGSIFPTSIGANPQLSIYGLVNHLAQGLARRLTGRNVTLA
ncbi:FAD-binding protein [Ramlibacter sp. RBP-2]|uniref:FAD-binding protein n=1 Tax=Ramlibacter lithotrophicus TaxID=2606681 RepID=A0A7X6DJ61_9BURK|nr:GMC family oxidoreductase [Ramlibacter lithotrophicus]NKE68157.1 FAD-binding protein [Ramlibacter lithotrophicus]